LGEDLVQITLKIGIDIIIRMRRIPLLLFSSLFFFALSTRAHALDTASSDFQKFLDAFQQQCTGYGWKDVELKSIPWQYFRTTQQKRPLMFVTFGDIKGNCTLLLGAVHGDETPTVYLLLKLIHHLKDHPTFYTGKCIIIAPLVNPDGFFASPPTRGNGAGIDNNRNFPTRDWHARALRLWKIKSKGNKRYYPGQKPGTEAETLFQMALMNRFKPRKILSLHSPLGFYDFDGPTTSLDSFEQWLDAVSKETKYPLKKFGFFPGSLGNYAGHERNIFTLTLELPSSEPQKGSDFYRKFQPAIMKFIDLSVSGRQPFMAPR
jgi:protein MpaA